MAYAWEEERPELAEVIRQLEEENEHTRAVAVRAILGGTAEDVREACYILQEHERAGYLSAPLAERRAQLSKKLNDQGA